MSGRRLLIIGATGMLGRPVAHWLSANGFDVRALVRDPQRARGLLPPQCELATGDVTDSESLRVAADGVEAIYINLAAPRSPKHTDIERTGVPRIVEAARQADVGRLLKISFMGVPQTADLWWQIRHKAESERILAESGIDCTIFHPTWFTESLPLFRQGGRLLVPKLPEFPVYWITGLDYARQVAAALTNDRTRNRSYVIQGPEPVSFRAAAERLAAAWEPGSLKVSEIPMWVLRLAAPLVADVRYLLDLLKVTVETNTVFEAQAAWDDLGAPTMTIEDYVEYMEETGDVPVK